MKQDAPPAVAAPDAANPPVSPPQEPADRPKKLDAALELAIKQRLKREEANQRLSLAVEQVRNVMNDYSLELSDFESMKNSPDADTATQPLDLKESTITKVRKTECAITTTWPGNPSDGNRATGSRDRSLWNQTRGR
jgi:hypothetical protein